MDWWVYGWIGGWIDGLGDGYNYVWNKWTKERELANVSIVNYLFARWCRVVTCLFGRWCMTGVQDCIRQSRSLASANSVTRRWPSSRCPAVDPLLLPWPLPTTPGTRRRTTDPSTPRSITIKSWWVGLTNWYDRNRNHKLQTSKALLRRTWLPFDFGALCFRYHCIRSNNKLQVKVQLQSINLIGIMN